MTPPDQLGYEAQFFAALTLTIIIEWPTLVFVARRIFKISPEDSSSRRLMFTAILASGATLPYIWFVLPAMVNLGASFLLFAGISEAFAVGAEMCIFQAVLRWPWGRALIAACFCNAATFILGLCITVFFP